MHARNVLRAGLAFLRRHLGGTSRPLEWLSVRESYRLWSETYDDQPDNRLLGLEAAVFQAMLKPGIAAGRRVVDIGCGTGRHWDRLLTQEPRSIAGVDASPEMLARLRARRPIADLRPRLGSTLPLADRAFDLVVSTLMLGHVPDAGAELREWTRVLDDGGHVLLTDFHPEALQRGVRRSFQHAGAAYEAECYLHRLQDLEGLFRSLSWRVVAREEVSGETTVPGAPGRHGETRAELPLVYGFLLQKNR